MKYIYGDIEKIKELINEKGMTQADLSVKMAYSEKYITDVLSSKKGKFSKEAYELMCKILEVDKEQLMRDVRLVDMGELKDKIRHLESYDETYNRCISDVLDIIG